MSEPRRHLVDKEITLSCNEIRLKFNYSLAGLI